jgi:hypothetical protein
MAVNYNSIQEFKNQFNGGTRPNRFLVTPEWPSSVANISVNEKFKIFATSMPKVELGTITVPYRGRGLNYAGDRGYSIWTIQVYDDNNSNNLWKAFHLWKEKIDGHVTHTVFNSDFSYKTLQKNWTIEQLSVNGNTTIRKLQLVNCWPAQIGPIDLDMSSQNQATFSVGLIFDYFNILTNIQSTTS